MNVIRRFFVLFAIATAFIATAPMATASAESYYMGTYSDGTDAYLLSETVRVYDYAPLEFKCTVFYGSNNYLYYRFYNVNGRPYYSNSEGYHAYVFGGESPIAANIYRFVRDNL